MDDETLDAVARAISFLGEVALRASAADLVMRARTVANSAEGADADADHQAESERRTQAVSGLRRAAAALESVESAGRTQAVSRLLEAVAALETVLGVGLNELGDAAADLARRCGEHREAVAALEKVPGVAAQQQRQALWWWLFWRRRGRAYRVNDVENGGLGERLLADGSTPTNLQEAASKAVEFLSNEAATPTHLLELAENIVLSAHNLAVPDQALREARDVLQQANSRNLMQAVNGLEAAAMGVQDAASAQQIMLRDPAVKLAAACKDYLEAFDAMTRLQHAATERAHARETALVAVQNAQPPLPQPDHGPGQGDDRRSGWLGHALSGSLTLAPYLMAGNAKLPKPLETNDRLTISFVLSLWWSIVASGAVCSSYARSRIEMCYAQLAARIGIYGTNIFAIYFFYWILGSGNTDARCTCLWFATVLHFGFLALACWRRDT